jgi:hypothetical protein
MTTALWIGLGLFTIGALMRIYGWRPFADAYAKRHAVSPPRSWLWTSTEDPRMERRRQIAAIGTALLWIGAFVAILNPAV